VIASVAACSIARGQWVAVSLHPFGATDSEVIGGANGAFAGNVRLTSGAQRPALWAGLSSEWTDLLGPSETFVGIVTSMWGDQQGGHYNGGALWSGTPESRIDLGGEGILGMGPGQQVGSRSLQIGTELYHHAVRWSGTVESMIDLHPSGFNVSYAYATDGVHQGGYVAETPTSAHLAAMWSGSAASYLNMNPTWAIDSQIRGMVPGQQVGWTMPTTGGTHATMWTGSAASALDLHPFPGFGSSGLAATIGFAQVGSSSVPGYAFEHAGIWFGTAASFVDLNQFLPAGYGESHANCIQEWNGQLLVGGWASRTGATEAFVWVLAPAPGTGAVLLLGGVLGARRRRGL
jgi:hypothetical protein